MILEPNSYDYIYLYGDADPSEVIKGKTFYSNSFTKQTGELSEEPVEDVNVELELGEEYQVQKGLHSGNSVISLPTVLASLTEANAAAGNIKKGKTAWVNGNLITGTKAPALKATAIKTSARQLKATASISVVNGGFYAIFLYGYYVNGNYAFTNFTTLWTSGVMGCGSSESYNSRHFFGKATSTTLKIQNKHNEYMYYTVVRVY